MVFDSIEMVSFIKASVIKILVANKRGSNAIDYGNMNIKAL